MVCFADSISIIAFIKHTDDHQNMTLIQVGKGEDGTLIWCDFTLCFSQIEPVSFHHSYEGVVYHTR